MTRHSTVSHVLALAVIGGTLGVAWLLACGPFLVDLKTVEVIAPAHLESYSRGELGIVRPMFARRFLVQAYRRMNGESPLPAIARAGVEVAGATTGGAIRAWEQLRATMQDAGSPHPVIQSYRRLPDYQTFENCLEDAFVSAASTLKARAARFGAGSPEFRDWLRAQDAVFSNCGGEALVVPEPAPATADPLIRADRAYQTAAAHFYAMRYDEAGRRFRAIADDAASPWRIYGRYLAARSAIRAATVPDAPASTAFAGAETDLRGVLEDSSARSLHDSARGLLDLIATRSRPIERVHTLSARLARANAVSDRELRDFQWLMDRLLGDTTVFPFLSIKDRDALAKDDDLASWLIAMQGSGDGAFDHALREWQRQRTVPWLAAVLWKIPAGHEATAQVLRAAAELPGDSPASATVAFLRVRLLARAGRTADARALLASAPRRVSAGYPPEAINLLDAERFMLASTFDELLRSAPRMSVVEAGDGRGRIKPLTAVFDDDAGRVFSDRLPIARLIEGAQSTALPPRLRLRVAAAAFTRTVALRRHEEALQVVPVLRTLAPALARDLDAFERAPDPDARHRAALLLLLRTPGLHARVQGVEDDWWFARGEAARTFDHTFRRNWWCSVDESDPADVPPASEVLALLYGTQAVPSPRFLSAAERAATAKERAAFAALGPAPNHLAAAAVEWARSRPQDADAAEALALAVEGTRWGCTDPRTTVLSRRAFETLHRLFPKTEWARRTKYWY